MEILWFRHFSIMLARFARVLAAADGHPRHRHRLARRRDRPSAPGAARASPTLRRGGGACSRHSSLFIAATLAACGRRLQRHRPDRLRGAAHLRLRNRGRPARLARHLPSSVQPAAMLLEAAVPPSCRFSFPLGTPSSSTRAVGRPPPGVLYLANTAGALRQHHRRLRCSAWLGLQGSTSVLMVVAGRGSDPSLSRCRIPDSRSLSPLPRPGGCVAAGAPALG